ncbi:MAG: hypothetical protein PGN09_08650 [Sphingomonas fennica]
MIRLVPPAAAMAALLAAGCTRSPPTLPTDVAERAATCGVVAAAEARTAAGAKGQLPIAAQGRILHYPLLAGAQGKAFDHALADRAVKAQGPIGEDLLDRKWQGLIPACAEAYPATRVADPVLPPPPADARLQCYMLADYMTKALGAQEGQTYDDAIARYGTLKTRLDTAMASRLGRLSPDALRQSRAVALAAAARLGQPIAVLGRCADRFG